MFVGGEFYTDNRWLSPSPTLSTPRGTVFLNGGKACLIVIADFLLDHGIDKILLPSYLCPSIVTTLERSGLRCDDYRVNPDLSIDLDDLAQKMDGCQVVYFINYFGFFHAPATLDFFKALRQKGMLVVEDNAQAGFPARMDGDFVFNSIRKLIGYDGGYLIAQQDVAPYLKKYAGRPNRRLPVIREYRSRLYRYLFRGRGSHTELEALFSQAEQYYETDLVVHGDLHEREQIERLDWKGIQQTRRENYQYLLGLISSIDEIKPIFPALQPDNMPLGLPVYFSGVSRDRVYDELGQAGIGLTIHWEDILTHPHTSQNRLAVDMASRMLTLAIDQRTSHKQIDYLVKELVKGIAAARLPSL
jgi:hypothetical protein